MKRIDCLIAVLFNALLLGTALANTAPELIHAKKFHPGVNAQDYWVSEKLDGVRAYWNGTFLVSRQGNRFYPPDWFTRNFPNTPLDGELWIDRNSFERTVSTVKKRAPIEDEWRFVNYYVFELPGAVGNFSDRIKKINHIVEVANNPHLRAVKQFRVDSHKALMAVLDTLVDNGGEGLMLHHQNAHYHTGRSDALFKLKRYRDAEARVIAHLPGKGKHTGRLGALLVQTATGKHFRIGSGFTDKQRENPPRVGAIITYKYYGLTRNGLPRFASFLRERIDTTHAGKVLPIP